MILKLQFAEETSTEHGKMQAGRFPGLLSRDSRSVPLSEMLPNNPHFQTSVPDDSNAGGLNPALRNLGPKTNGHHRSGEN